MKKFIGILHIFNLLKINWIMKPNVTYFWQLDLSKTYTYADYLTWDFDERIELIKGWIYKISPAPRRLHQKIEGNFF